MDYWLEDIPALKMSVEPFLQVSGRKKVYGQEL